MLISGLEPGEEYEVQVLGGTLAGFPDIAVNHLSWSIVQMPSSTAESSLPSAPSLSLKWINATSISATWKMPPQNVVEPTQYKLRFRGRNGEFSDPIFLPGNASSFLLTDLGQSFCLS